MNLIALLIGLIVERLATRFFHWRRMRWMDRIIDAGFRMADGFANWPAVIPVVLLALYQALTATLYGRGLLLDAVAYAGQFRLSPGRGLFDKTLAGLAFTGGCVSSLLFFVPRLWSRRAIGIAAANRSGCREAMYQVPRPPRLNPVTRIRSVSMA